MDPIGISINETKQKSPYSLETGQRGLGLSRADALESAEDLGHIQLTVSPLESACSG